MRSVLILGGGFAGRAAARRLARERTDSLAVHLIDERAESVFSPLLPDLISARIRPQSMTTPIGVFCRRNGIGFTQAAVREIAPGEGRVVTDQGRHTADFVLLAMGCVTNYFGHDELARRAVGLKSPEEGVRIHRRLCERIDAARAA